MYEVELEFSGGWGALIKNPFCAGGMDILWNYTMWQGQTGFLSMCRRKN